MRILSIILSVILFVASPAFAEPLKLKSEIQYNGTEHYQPNDTVTFIIEINGAPTTVKDDILLFSKNSDYQSAEDEILSAQNKVMNNIKTKINPESEKYYTYTTLFNGFSLEAKYSDLEQLKNIPGVCNVYISENYEPIKPLISNAESQTGITSVQNRLGLSGEGEIIAILDSEFDVSHEFFESEPQNPKYTKNDIASIIKNTSLSTDISVNQVYKSAKIPFAYDYGCNDDSTFDNRESLIHGTHVTGIAAGKNGKMSDGTSFSGVAPEAQLVLMKISNENGGLPEASILAALDDAAKFGVSAVNMSFGTTYSSIKFRSKYKSVLENAKNAGILLSTAAGNSAMGYEEENPRTENIDAATSGAPAEFTYSTSVASAYNSVSYAVLGNLNLSGNTQVKYALAHSDSVFYTNLKNKQYEYVFCGEGTANEFSQVDVSGKIALIRRGNITFVDKAVNAAEAGAVGIIIWNTEDKYINTSSLSLPAAIITNSDGQIMFDSSEKKFTLTQPHIQSYDSISAGKISSYSSLCTNDMLELKPEMTAPGGNIYSSIPDNKYAIMSGTSMAAPHITGITALLNQYYKTNPFSKQYNELNGIEKVYLFENLLMSSAEVIKNDDIPVSPRSQGAGLVNIDKATQTPVILIGTENKSKISLKDNLSDTVTLNFTAQNLTDKPVVYNSLSFDVTTDGYTSKNGTYIVDGIQKMNVISSNLPESITVPANGNAEISLTLELEKSELENNLKIFKNGFFIDGFIYLSSDTACNISIPFTGFYGDWKKVPIFDNTMYDDEKSVLLRNDVSSSSGTYLGGIIEDYIYMSGQNLTSSNINSEYIAFSPNSDSIFDYPTLILQPLRSCTIGLTLSKYTTPNTIMKKINVSGGINKYSSVMLQLTDFSSLSDGKYLLNINGYSTYGELSSSPDDTITIPFTIDTQLPEITNVSLNKQKGILTVSAKDNHYIQAINISYTDKNGKKISKTKEFENIKSDDSYDFVSADFETGNISANDIQISVFDYAMNIESGNLNDYLYDLNILSNSVSYKDSEITIINYEVLNRSSDTITATPLIAFYNENNTLIYAEPLTAESFIPGTNTKTIRINKSIANTSNMRIFLWDSSSGMKPLTA